MPIKTPDVWDVIWRWATDFFATPHHPICSLLTAIILSLSRSFLYEKKRTLKRRSIEAIMCGLLAYCSRPLLVQFKFSEELMMPLGAIIGLFGIDALRAMGLKFLNSKIEDKNDEFQDE